MPLAEELTPEQLWDRAQKSDKAALEALYERLAPPVLGMLVHILTDHEAAAEILGEVLEQLWTRSRTGPWERGSLAVQVTLMARRAAIDRLRVRESRALLDGARLDSLMASPAWLPKSADAASLDERRELLKRIMKQLPAPQRRVVELAVFEGYSEGEIAGNLGIPLGRAKAELRATMRFLRHRLQAVMGTWATNI